MRKSPVPQGLSAILARQFTAVPVSDGHMSKHLETVLNQYLEWLREKSHPVVDALQPGLSQSEINELASGLPYTLTEEIQTLYRWRNGASEQSSPFLRFHTFLPLDEAISLYHEACEVDKQIKGMAQNDLRIPELDSFRPGWFPVFMLSDLLFAYFVNCGDDGSERGNVIETGEGSLAEVVCGNLTQMMEEMLADCKAGKYSIDEDGSFVTQEEVALMPQRPTVSNADLKASLLTAAHEQIYVLWPEVIKSTHPAKVTEIKVNVISSEIKGSGSETDPYVGTISVQYLTTFMDFGTLIVDNPSLSTFYYLYRDGRWNSVRLRDIKR